MKALLVIDMQMGSFMPETSRYDTEGVMERINAVSNRFRQSGDKVIFIQHDGTKQNDFLPGTPDWNILPGLVQEQDDIFIAKTANDCFYNSALGQTLQDAGINEIIVTGCATDFCVDTTIRSALAKEYNVTVISNGHTTANRPHLTAKKIIDHHNWIWQNMTPTRGKIEVVTFEEFV